MKIKTKQAQGTSSSIDANGRDGNWGDRDGFGGGKEFSIPAEKVGLWLFLITATVLFVMLTNAYLMRKGMPDWSALPLPGILWPNTGVLLLSSLALEGARRSRHDRGRMKSLLLSSGALAMVFILGQLWAWQQLHSAGYFLATNPSSSFFYLLTALHGAHVLGGLVAWVRTTIRVWKHNVEAQSSLGVELCAFYWHFLLLVWLGILGMLWLTA